VIDATAEYGVRRRSGDVVVRAPGADIDRIYPLAMWITDQQAEGLDVVRRVIIPVEDWRPVTELDRQEEIARQAGAPVPVVVDVMPGSPAGQELIRRTEMIAARDDLLRRAAMLLTDQPDAEALSRWLADRARLMGEEDRRGRD
jgi:hypothetical protein